jgi:hypothetical protein
VVGPINLVCKKHKQKLENKISKFCEQEKLKAKKKKKNHNKIVPY